MAPARTLSGGPEGVDSEDRRQDCRDERSDFESVVKHFHAHLLLWAESERRLKLRCF
jgi:hypothetical protein